MNSLRPRTLVDYLALACRRKLLITGTALVAIAASVIAIERLPNIYESSTFILVESSQSGSTPIDLQHRLGTVRQQVMSRTMLDALIKKHGLYKDLTAKGEPADSIQAQMRGDISVDVTSTRPDATEAFTISFRARDPQTAQDVTADLADQLIDDNVQALQSEATGEAEVLSKRALELSDQLHSMESKLPWLMSLKEDAPLVGPVTKGPSGLPSQEAVRGHEITMGNLKDQQYSLQQQITNLDARIAELRQLVERQKKTPVTRDNPVFGQLIAKRAELMGQRDNLIKRQGLTDKHPRVIAIDDQVASINHEIAQLSREMSASVGQTPEESQLATLETQRHKLKVELEVAGREFVRQDSLPLSRRESGVASAAPAAPHDAASARLAQDYLGLKQTYKQIKSKLEDAELKRQAMGNSKVERVRILDRANLPQMPTSPNRRLLELVGVALGLVVGLAVALAAQMRRLTSLQDVVDVEYYTRLPLLAAIPQTLMPAERRRKIRLAGFRIALGTIGAVVSVFALAKLFMFAHLFELIGKK
jgi:succinoglycan biosynthesis transport protein ExoP